MLLALIRIALGMDMALGIYNYVLWSWFLRQPFQFAFLLLSLLSTHLPDADMLPYLLLRNRCQLASHWVIGHHPLLVLPILAMLCALLAHLHVVSHLAYAADLVLSGVSLHFLHDGLGSLGFPWLSPFSRTYFRFRSGRFSAVPPAEINERKCRIPGRSAVTEITSRAAPLTMANFLILGFAMFALAVFIFKNQTSHP